MEYTELQVTSNFTFLRGASHPEELMEQAAQYGYTTLAITDRNTLAGIVRAHAAAKKLGNIRLIVGCRLDVTDGPSILAYPMNKDAYASLSSLLTLGNLRTEKGLCDLSTKDVFEFAQGSKLVLLHLNLMGTCILMKILSRRPGAIRRSLVRMYILPLPAIITVTIKNTSIRFVGCPMPFRFRWLLQTTCIITIPGGGSCRM